MSNIPQLLVHDHKDNVGAASTGIVADNCRSIAAVQDRIDSEGAFILDSFERNFRNYVVGSPDVGEETADSFSVGAVFTPESQGSFSLALDYYSIEIEEAITATDPTILLTRCHNTPTASFDVTCGGNVFRDPRTGDILDVERAYANDNSIETSGLDLEARYQFGNLGSGDLSVWLVANFLTEFNIIGSNGDVTDVKGEVLYPDLRLLLNLDYTIGDFSLTSQVRYRDSTVDNNANTRHTEELNSIDSVTYVDLRGSYNFNDSTTIYLGATNLFDVDPPELAFGFKYIGHANSNARAFDYIGRQIFAGVNVSF